MGTGFAKRKKQAKKMQDQFSQMQDDMKNIEATGQAGNGLVTITLNGENKMTSIKIKPECVDVDDVDGLEDLITVAYEDAAKILEEKMPKMPGMDSLGSAMGGASGLPFGL